MTQIRSNADLLLASGAVKSALTAQGERWELWTAEYRVLRATIQQHVLFLRRDFRLQDTAEAAAQTSGLADESLTVVTRGTARLGKDDLDRIKRHFDRKQAVTASQFLFSVVQNALVPPDELSGQVDPYFIEPSVLFPDETDPVPALKKK